jgi:hypothetical protein
VNGLSPWSPQQRRWLQALGHVVWRQAGVDDDRVEPAVDGGDRVAEPGPHVAGRASIQAPGARTFDDVPRRAPPAPAAIGDIAPPSPAAARPGMRRPAGLPDRLQLAMLRASGLDPADPLALEAMAQWPVDRLRGDGAAKRAFWPQLRALRRRP